MPMGVNDDIPIIYMVIILVLMFALLCLASWYGGRDYNKQVCKVWGYQEDCETKLNEGEVK